MVSSSSKQKEKQQEEQRDRDRDRGGEVSFSFLSSLVLEEMSSKVARVFSMVWEGFEGVAEGLEGTTMESGIQGGNEGGRSGEGERGREGGSGCSFFSLTLSLPFSSPTRPHPPRQERSSPDSFRLLPRPFDSRSLFLPLKLTRS